MNNNYTIKGCGKIYEILTALKTIKMVLGGNAKLTDLAIGTRYARIYTAQTQQFDEGENGK